jgi:phage terminase small subunit
MDNLTPKQHRFVEQYLLDLNATRAAIRAGYSRKAARQQGAENLSKPVIKAAIEAAKAERRKRTEFDQDKILRELAKLGFSDMRELASWGPHGLKWTDSAELTDEAAACVQEVSFTLERRYDKNGYLVETGNMKIKTHDKKAALKLLGDHLGVFDSQDTDVGKMADSFMAGIHTIKALEPRDLSG